MWGRALGRSGSGSRGAGGCLDSHSTGTGTTHTRSPVVTFWLLAIGVIISITPANYTPSLLPFPFLCPCSIPSSTQVRSSHHSPPLLRPPSKHGLRRYLFQTFTQRQRTCSIQIFMSMSMMISLIAPWLPEALSRRWRLQVRPYPRFVSV